MAASKDRQVEIAQAIAEIYDIVNRVGLFMEARESRIGDSYFEIWSDDVADIVGMFDAVTTALDGSI